MARTQGGALVESAKELFAVMGAPFEGDLQTIGYQAELTLPVGADQPIFNRPEAADFFSRLVDRNVDQHRPWRASIGYLPMYESLGFNSLSVPVQVPNRNEWVRFQRDEVGFIEPSLLRGEGKHREQIALKERGSVMTLKPHIIDRLLLDAGYTQVFTDSTSLRMGLAELSDRALDWSSREETETSVDPGASTSFTRNIAHFADVRSGHRKRGHFATKLSAAYEREVRPGLFQRWLISFAGDDAMVDMPKVLLQRVERPSLRPDNPLDSKSRVTDTQPFKVTASLLDQLTTGILATLVELD